MLIINLLNASVEVDGAAGVLEVVAGVVNVDAVVLVCLVALQLVSGVPKKTLFSVLVFLSIANLLKLLTNFSFLQS